MQLTTQTLKREHLLVNRLYISPHDINSQETEAEDDHETKLLVAWDLQVPENGQREGDDQQVSKNIEDTDCQPERVAVSAVSLDGWVEAHANGNADKSGGEDDHESKGIANGDGDIGSDAEPAQFEDLHIQQAHGCLDETFSGSPKQLNGKERRQEGLDCVQRHLVLVRAHTAVEDIDHCKTAYRPVANL